MDNNQKEALMILAVDLRSCAVEFDNAILENEQVDFAELTSEIVDLTVQLEAQFRKKLGW